ncbi:FtsX-like permease family protein [Bacillus chungangensis]|uniref:ABC transport system permease protein n=1 Tax=Bacillus chungangensis TaxID=587633 RepID=A0ABT9WTA8_9BACI|nr:ABC transporter permease [Bacillus chungangensis]MDQ0176358.1 putative ABC transport system permease protein [Bacillus chungangensis]
MIIQKNEKLLYKEVMKSILKNKSYIILLYTFIMLTSFMYFFVQFSIDKNMEKLQSILNASRAFSDNQADLFVALQSNNSLAWTFLLCFLIMSAFVLYLFYKHYFNQHQKEIGCFKALGFKDFSIVKTYMFFTISLSFFATITGMLFGWIFSSVLLNAYKVSYGIPDIEKGIHANSIFYGVILVILVLCMTTILSCKAFYKKEAALLINAMDIKKEKRTITFIADKVSSVLPENKRFPIRIVLRKPTTLILCIIAVGVSTSLFIMSISLYLSSDKIYQSQTEGHNYSYNVKFDEIHQEVSEEHTNSVLYLEVSTSLYTENYNEPIAQQIIGLSDGGNLLELYNQSGELLSIQENNEILIGVALQEVYGLKKGDEVTISISGENYSVIVANVAENAESNCIYMSKEQLAKWMHIPETSYNGLLSTEIDSTMTGQIITKEERLLTLDEETVSNRMSAVINQLLGCVAGCILIYLVLLLNFQDSSKEMLILNLLGYKPKEINKMLISIYRPIINIAFLLMLFPSVVICKEIHRSLSIQTVDYIPFQTNVFIILGIFVVIQIIYAIVEAAFTTKIKKIILSETIHHHLQ